LGGAEISSALSSAVKRPVIHEFSIKQNSENDQKHIESVKLSKITHFLAKMMEKSMQWVNNL
jgi:hypothetical protein